MNNAEAAVLAWFTDIEPPVGIGTVDAASLTRALVVVWPEWMGKIHNATNAVIDTRYRKIKDKNIGEMHMNRELQFEDLAYRRSLNRIRDSLSAIYIWEKDDLEANIKKLIQREKHYNKLRMEALIKRLDGIIQHVDLRMDDPRSDYDGGALWVMDETKETHTEDCLAMQGKTWSWSVLRFVNPANRHPGCGCHLEPDYETSPLIMAPNIVPTSWDMGVISPKPLYETEISPVSYNTLRRSF